MESEINKAGRPPGNPGTNNDLLSPAHGIHAWDSHSLPPIINLTSASQLIPSLALPHQCAVLAELINSANNIRLPNPPEF